MSDAPKKNILLCGGGNAIHCLTAYIGSQPNYNVSVFSTFPGEADEFRAAIPEEGIKCMNDLGPDKYGKPVKVSDKAEEVVPGADMIIFALPSFAHQMYLEAIAPYVKPGVIIGAMPGEGGFDMCARHVLGTEFVDQSNIFALETLPWAVRIVEYGKSVEVLGTKKEIDVVITEGSGRSAESVRQMLQQLVGSAPDLKLACNFLAVTLMNINSVWHPTISYAYYSKHWDGKTPFDEPPLFYYGADAYTGEKLSNVSDEVLEVKRVLQEKYPGLDLSSLHHVREWMLRSYGDDIGDKTNIHTMLITNKGYRGLTHPTVKVEVDGQTKYMPNFKYRFTEDLPMGLIVTRGIAELAGVATPNMDDVIGWCQECMGKEYLVDSKFVGKDIKATRSPQTYGFTDLETFLRTNRYI